MSPQVPIDALRTALVPYGQDDRVSLRAFAAGINLWLDKASGKCSLEETEKAFGKLVDNADGWLQDCEEAGELADLDRYATYHVLWRTTGLLYPHPLELAPGEAIRCRIDGSAAGNHGMRPDTSHVIVEPVRSRGR